MNGLFVARTTRRALLIVLALVAGLLVLAPDRIQSVVGGTVELWQGLVGAGFATAAWLGWQIISGVEPAKAAYEAFFVASVLAIAVILTHWSPGWIFPLLAAILIAILALRGRLAMD